MDLISLHLRNSAARKSRSPLSLMIWSPQIIYFTSPSCLIPRERRLSLRVPRPERLNILITALSSRYVFLVAFPLVSAADVLLPCARQYMPAVGDSKRAIDEYYSEIMMGGHNILSLYNLCEVSYNSTEIHLRFDWRDANTFTLVI